MKRALVTGGGGFVGGAIIEACLAQGLETQSLSRTAQPALRERGIVHHELDLAEGGDALRHALEGVDTIFHVAAKTGVWGPRKEFYRANVLGTRQLLSAARAAGVARLVYTSSPSVCFDGKDHRRASNELPRATRFNCPYPETKAIAEAEVLDANDERGLATVALRPHLVIGPGDPHLVPRLIERGRAGRLAIVGDGQNEVSLTYVENAAHAHLCAARALADGGACAGRAYFVAQEEPVRLWEWTAALLRELDVPPIKRRLSRRLARTAGGALELVWRGLSLSGEPPMTRFVADQLASSHSYDLAPLRRDTGYEERVDLATATKRILEDWRAREGAPTGS